MTADLRCRGLDGQASTGIVSKEESEQGLSRTVVHTGCAQGLVPPRVVQFTTCKTEAGGPCPVLGHPHSSMGRGLQRPEPQTVTTICLNWSLPERGRGGKTCTKQPDTECSCKTGGRGSPAKA